MYSKDLEICAYLQQKSWLLLFTSFSIAVFLSSLSKVNLPHHFTAGALIHYLGYTYDAIYCLVQSLDPYQFSITALFFIPSITLSLKLGCSL